MRMLDQQQAAISRASKRYEAAQVHLAAQAWEDAIAGTCFSDLHARKPNVLKAVLDQTVLVTREQASVHVRMVG